MVQLIDECDEDEPIEVIVNDKVNKAVELVKEVYKTDGGEVGGYGHIVFDDGNIENGNIEWCIAEAEKGEYGFSKECQQASMKALKYFLELTEQERHSAYMLS